jgi:hypothetical protein
MNHADVSYHGPMSEDDYLDVVLRIQQAMAIEPFQASLVDVVKLLADWREHNTEIRQLRTKLDLLRECLRPGLEDAPDGPATFLRAARKIVGRDKQG